MRQVIIAGNWKMNTTLKEGRELIESIKASCVGLDGDRVKVVVCPPFTHLAMAHDLLSGTNVGLGAQNMYFEDKGAYTGEVSPLVIKDLCQYVILGHSERRGYFGETDQGVNKKIKAALTNGIKPIVCIGESLEIRDSNSYLAFVEAQVRSAFEGVVLDSAAEVIFAYEPIWAIGTGRAASAEQGQEVIEMIRGVLSELYPDLAQEIHILYGGSSNDGNIAGFLAEEDIDGALVGGASIKADVFGQMIKIANQS